MNLLSKESRKLSKAELTVLNTISELVGTAIQRTRLQQSYSPKDTETDNSISQVLESRFLPKLEMIIACLKSSENAQRKVNEVLRETTELRKDIKIMLRETKAMQGESTTSKAFSYPEKPLTKRELEVLNLIKTGLTNEQIGKQLFISERTVKFHITSILSKLHATNRTEAVDIGIKRGLLGI